MKKTGKIRNSVLAKIMAWLLISVSALCFVASAAGIGFMAESGAYAKNLQEMRQELYETVSYRYSLLALQNMGTDLNEKFFADKQFRYGIIQADSLDGLDLNRKSTYLERNFSEKVTEQDLYVVPVTRRMAKDGTMTDTIVYTDGLFTGNAYQLHEEPETEEHLYAEKICYDTASGILYYYADKQYYPVRKVHIENIPSGDVINLYYDFKRGMYRNDRLFAGEETAAGEVTKEAEEEVEVPAAESALVQTDNGVRTVQQILETEPYLTLNMLDVRDYAGDDMWYFILDDVREAWMSEMKQVDLSSVSKKKFTDQQDYYLNENYTLCVRKENSSQEVPYQIVSILPTGAIASDLGNADMFVQANGVAHIVWDMRYAALFLLFGSFVILLGSTIFLIKAAGHRAGSEEIVPRVWDKIPFDLYTVLVGAAEFGIFVLFMGLADSGLHREALVLYVVFMVLLALIMGWLLLWYLLGFSVRVKLGGWWRNTICYRILHWCKKGCQAVLNNLSFLWKVIVFLVLLAGVEFFGIAVAGGAGVGGIFTFWFMEKLVLYPLILWICIQVHHLTEGMKRIAEGEAGYQIETAKMQGIFKEQGEYINHISDGISSAVEERMKSERFKTELITNVSHDIKTPLTSIINYVDLLEKEELHNEKAQEYLEVLDRQSGRLKKLIEDLIEASKASTGSLAVHMEKLEAGIFMVQTVGEFEEKTKAAGLDLIIAKPEYPVYIMADSRHFWRVIDNLMNNICKYAQSGTRVYIDLEAKEKQVCMTFRNTSKYPLNVSSEELMERFVRGDASRNTEGSGLGLSIANSLMELMGGTFTLYVDGDLFKVELGFPEYK